MSPKSSFPNRFVEDRGDIAVEGFACVVGCGEDLVFEPAGDADLEVDGLVVSVRGAGFDRHRGG